MLINEKTRDKCGKELKVVHHDKIKTNNNKTSVSSMPAKAPSPVIL